MGRVALHEILPEVVEVIVMFRQFDVLVASLRMQALPHRRLAVHDKSRLNAGGYAGHGAPPALKLETKTRQADIASAIRLLYRHYIGPLRTLLTNISREISATYYRYGVQISKER